MINPSHKLNQIVESLLLQYQHIVNECDTTSFSSENIIEYVINYYQDIINCMPGNVYWLDKNCNAIGCNKNVLDMFGFNSVESFKGLTFKAMGDAGKWSPLATKSFYEDTMQVIKTGKFVLNIEEPPIPHFDGRVLYFLTSRVPLFDKSNNVIGVVGISVDITELKNTQIELKKAKEEAEAASRAKSEFVANMSHDIKTPLAGIISIAELLSYRLQNEELEFANSLLSSGQQLMNFFDTCLEIFKLENNDLFRDEHFDINHILQDIRVLFEPAIKAKGLAFSINMHGDQQCYFHGCRTGIYRVILNLVANAIKFTEKGAIIINVVTEIITFPYAKMMVIVKDTGIGIAKDKQKIIFDQFTRLVPSYKGTYQGSGMGLYIVQKFVNAMHGNIQVQSLEESGSEFTFTVPVKIIEPHSLDVTHSTLKEKPSIHSTNRLIKVLLVEDNIITQRMQNSLLTSLNCEVDVASSGENALTLFEPDKYDLIFLDIGLPGISGDAVSKQIRVMETTTDAHVPIIGLTAHLSDEFKEYCSAAGIEDVFNKPLSREQALLLIERYCE